MHDTMNASGAPSPGADLFALCARYRQLWSECDVALGWADDLGGLRQVHEVEDRYGDLVIDAIRRALSIKPRSAREMWALLEIVFGDEEWWASRADRDGGPAGTLDAIAMQVVAVFVEELAAKEAHR